MDYRRLTKSTKKTRNKSQMHSNNAWIDNTKRTDETKMIKTRMLGIFNNLLLECQSNNHLETQDINQIMSILTKKWKE